MTEDIMQISNAKRLVAVHAMNEDTDEAISDAIESCCRNSSSEVVVFTKQSAKKIDKDGVLQVLFPDSFDTTPKQKNFMLKWCQERGFTGFLHLIETCIRFNSRTQDYMDKLESTMNVLDYNVHLSTIADRCNYMFNKFCPRLTINVDDYDLKQRFNLPDKLCFTSHSNISYVTFNFKAFGDQLPLLDERFTVGMFIIIEFLARRRASSKPGQLYYMNQYLSISDEVGAYGIVNAGNQSIDQKKMQEENELFKSLDINYAPDNNVDIVLDALYNKLKEKAA